MDPALARHSRDERSDQPARLPARRQLGVPHRPTGRGVAHARGNPYLGATSGSPCGASRTLKDSFRLPGELLIHVCHRTAPWVSNRASVWFVLIALLWGCGTTRQKPDEPEVKSVNIEGARQVSEGAIKDKILTEATSWLPFSSKKYFDPNAWQVDLRRIQLFYQAEGFYQAKVVEDVITPKPPDGVELTVKVEEGKPTRIARLDVEGMDALPQDHRKQVLSEIKIKVGDVLKEAEWEALKGHLQSKLHQLGYAEASVSGEIFVDVEKALADGRLNVDPGQRYRFGDIVVATGPRPRVPTAWVKDQAEGAIKKGNWFSESALTEAQNSLFKMGVFGGVKVTPGAPNRQEGTLPVVVDVREAPFHSLRLGGGIGAEQLPNEF